MFKAVKQMERGIRNSAKALIIRDGKLLALRLRDADSVFYILPGGGQQTEELLPQAMEREVAEELGLRVQAGDIAFVIEGAKGERRHRVDLVFRCEVLGAAPSTALQPDAGQEGFDWLDIASLNTAPLYPSRLRRAVMNLHAGLPQPVYLGNENMGDPEITD